METASRQAIDRVTALADEHARAFIASMPLALTEAELEAALSGTLIQFLSDALLTSTGR
jgi:hypothetical protein